jgi:hypothetical protein
VCSLRDGNHRFGETDRLYLQGGNRRGWENSQFYRTSTKVRSGQSELETGMKGLMPGVSMGNVGIKTAHLRGRMQQLNMVLVNNELTSALKMEKVCSPERW